MSEQKRLDRPDLNEADLVKIRTALENPNLKEALEAMEAVIAALILDIEEEPEWAGARHLNLDSELEEAKKQGAEQERERITTHLDKLCKYNPIRTDALRRELGKYVQALKEDKIKEENNGKDKGKV